MDELANLINEAWRAADALQGGSERGDVKRELAILKTHLEDAGSRLSRALVTQSLGSPPVAA